ncbi:unnamed protein product [Amoebophrya sp. A120]|nr:unnamed protein product [Amoebophrya sp. A120]|eukprot:GSA120T00017260001.1
MCRKMAISLHRAGRSCSSLRGLQMWVSRSDFLSRPTETRKQKLLRTLCTFTTTRPHSTVAATLDAPVATSSAPREEPVAPSGTRFSIRSSSGVSASSTATSILDDVLVNGAATSKATSSTIAGTGCCNAPTAPREVQPDLPLSNIPGAGNMRKKRTPEERKQRRAEAQASRDSARADFHKARVWYYTKNSGATMLSFAIGYWGTRWYEDYCSEQKRSEGVDGNSVLPSAEDTAKS